VTDETPVAEPPATPEKPTAKKAVAKQPRGFTAATTIGVLTVVVGLVIACCGKTSTYVGLLIMVVGLPLVVVTVTLAAVWRPGNRALGVLLALVALVTLAIGLAALTGQIVRWSDPADYTGRYGTVATATIPDQCTNKVTRRGTGGAGAADADYVCPGSTWTLNGVQHTGPVVLGFDDICPESKGCNLPETAQAYMLGDKGYSVKRVGKIEDVSKWGAFPNVYLLALLVAAAALIGFWWLDERRMPPRDLGETTAA
jgi:hypothetical protein